MMTGLVGLFILALAASGIHGYPGGAGTGACLNSNMIPGHTPYQPQTTPPPYTIELSQNEYCPDETIYGMSASMC